MAIENDFLPFATGGSANVLTQAQYAALVNTLIANGFSAGVAPSAQLNKVWRQSSIMAAVIAQFIVNNTGQTAIDDGTTATLLANLTTAISVTARQNPVLTDTGTANNYVVANLAAFTAYPTSSGLTLDVSIANTNTGASQLNVDGLGNKPILGLGLQPLQSNELVQKGVACLMYVVASTVNGGNGAWVVMECTGGAQQVAPATQSNHAMQLGQATGRLLRTTIYTIVGGAQQVSVDGGAFTSTGASTFTPLALTNAVTAELVGGGGASGGCATTGASQAATGTGGGAGAYALGRFASAFSGLTVTVGAAGVAGGTGGSNGGNGGTSSFGALISAPGGNGGLGSAAFSAAYVTQGALASSLPSGGNLVQYAGAASGAAVSPNVTNVSLSPGASTTLGGGGRPGNGGVGGTGSGYGSGAGGSQLGQNTTTVTGAAGQPGAVIIREYA